MENIRLIRHGLLIGVFILISATASSGRVNTYKKRANFRVTFINKYWKSLHLEVKVGNNSNPEDNPTVRNVILTKDGSVTVEYDVLCYYRRDADPDRADGVHFTQWTGTGCSMNQACVENL